VSLDLSSRLFFPISSASDVLRALSKILLAGGEYAVHVAAPDGQVVVFRPGDPRLGNPKRTEVLGFEAFGGFIAVVPTIVRRKKRVSRPIVNKWGDVEYHKIVRQRVSRYADFNLSRGREFFEVGFSNLSNDLSFFDSAAVYSKLARVYEEGRGVVAARVEMLENWRTFAPPHDEIHMPDDFDEEEHGIDGLVDLLVRSLGRTSA
jgi:hypothetical protein